MKLKDLKELWDDCEETNKKVFAAKFLKVARIIIFPFFFLLIALSIFLK